MLVNITFCYKMYLHVVYNFLQSEKNFDMYLKSIVDKNILSLEFSNRVIEEVKYFNDYYFEVVYIFNEKKWIFFIIW